MQYKKFSELRGKLAESLQNRYLVYATIKPVHWPNILERADILISRAGANIVSQVLVIKRPAIFIPLPFAYLNEQNANALFAKDFGIAEIIDQEDLTENILLTKINKITRSWENIVRKVKEKKSPDENSSFYVVDMVDKLLH